MLNWRVLAAARLKVGFEHGTGFRSCEGSSSPPGASPATPEPSAPLLEATLCWRWDFSVCASILGGRFFLRGRAAWK